MICADFLARVSLETGIRQNSTAEVCATQVWPPQARLGKEGAA